MDWNQWTAVGKVQGQPNISGDGDAKQAFFYFSVNRRVRNANGQWVDKVCNAPVFAFGNKADLIDRYVVEGQELMISAEYDSWENNGAQQHGFMLQNVSFGFKPRNNANPAPAHMQ